MSYAQKEILLKLLVLMKLLLLLMVLRKKKALGYVFQDIKGADVVEAREVNVTDAMVGKVSGLQLVEVFYRTCRFI